MAKKELFINENSTSGERLAYYMAKKGLNSVSFSEKIGVTSAVIRHWRKDRMFPTREKIDLITSILEINRLDLYPNAKENRKKITEDELKNNIDKYLHLLPTDPLPSYMLRVPFFADKIVSEDKEMTPESLMIDAFMLQKKYRNKEIVAVMMYGDSMSPYLSHQDIAIVDKSSGIVGDGKYALETKYGYVVKNLKFLLNGNVRVSSENRSYRGENHEGDGFDEELSEEMFEVVKVIGLVVGRVLKN